MALAVVLMLAVGRQALAVTCTTSTTGNWNSQATWGGAGGGCGASGPVAGDTVVINGGNVVTLTAGASAATVTLNGATSGGASTSTLSINGQTLTLTGNLAINEGSNGNRKTLLSIGAGTVTVGGSITRAANTANTAGITFTSGTLNLAGALATGYSPFTQGTGTVNFNGTAAQTIPTYTYNTIKVNNTVGATLAAATTAANLTIGDVTAGSLFSDGGFQLTAAGTLNLNSGTLSLGSAGAATTFPGFGTRTIVAGTTVTYASGVAQTVSTTPSYSNLTFSGAGTKTVASGTLSVGATWNAGSTTDLSANNAVVSVTGDLSGAGAITQGTGLMTIGGNWSNTGTFSASSAGVTLTGSGKTIGGPAAGITFTTLTVNGTYTNGNAGTLTVSTALSGSGTLTQGANATLAIGGTSGISGLNATTNTPNKVTYTGTAAQSVKAITYYNLDVNSGNTASLVGTTAVNNNLTITAGTLDAAGNALSVTGTTTVSGTLAHSVATGTNTYTGDVTVNGGGVWSEAAAITASFGGSLQNNGTFSANTGVHTFTGSGKTFSGASIISIPSVTVNGSYENDGTLTVGSALSGTGALINGSGANAPVLNIGGTSSITTLTASPVGNTVNYTGASATVKATTYYNLGINASGATLGGAVTVGNNLAIAAGASLSDNGFQIVGNATGTLSAGAGATLSLGAGTATAFPTNFAVFSLDPASTVAYVASAAQTVSPVPPYANLTINNGAVVVTSLGGSTTVSGTLTLGGSGTLAVGGNTLTLNGPSTAGTPSKLTTTSSSSLTFGGGSAGVTVPAAAVPPRALNNLTINNSTSTVTLGSAIALSGNLSNNGLFSVGGNDVTMGGSAAQSIGGSQTATFSNLTISNTSAAVAANATTTSMVVNGTFTVNSSALFSPAAALVVSGSGTLTGSGTVQVTRTAATADFSSQYTITNKTLAGLTVEYAGSGTAQTVSALTYGGLKINDASGVSLAGATSVGGTLTLTSGTLTVGANTLTLNGPAIAGTATNLSTSGSSSLVFGGSSPGVTLPAAAAPPRQLKSLTVNNASGVTLGGDATVNAGNNGGALTLTSGVITAGANTLYVANAGSVSRPANGGYVFGNLKRNVATGAAQSPTFDVGDASKYAPVQITFGTVTTAGDLTAQTVSGQHPDIANSTIGSADDISRYWVVTNSGLAFDNYSATLTYVNGQTPGGDYVSATPSYADYGFGKADACNGSLQSCTWSYPTLASVPNSTTPSIQASGMTSFSSFAVGNNVASFSIAAIPNQTQGQQFNITVTARNQSGNTASSFNGAGATVTVSCSSGCSSFTSGTFTNGTATIPVTITASGSNFTITVTRTGGTATGTSNAFNVASAVSSFNAFDTGTAAGAVVGNIQTKTAATDITLAVVAISGSSQASTFNDNVKLEFLANATPGANYDGTTHCPNSSSTLQTIASAAISGGRSNITFATIADGVRDNVYRDVRVRISYPTGSPTLVFCSNDSFAIRPSGFAISVTDATWTSAGTTRTLNNTGSSGGTVHRAGQPFTITATPSPGSATNYDGNITIASGGVACVSFGSGCANGTLSLGTWSGTGTRSTSTASYLEAGVFGLTLEDADFASIDNSDGSSFTVPQTGGAVSVGRFVPDHFKFTTPSTPQFQTFGAACASARSFTYIGQPFWYVTAPSATLQAVAADDSTVTTNYRGSLFHATISESYTSSTGPALSTASIGSAQLTPANGTASYAASATGTLSYARDNTTPAALFNANISLSVSASDTSEADGTIATTTPQAFSSIGFDSGTEFRYGRLRLLPATGPVTMALPVPIRTEYWTGTGFATNAADNCTSLAAASVTLSNFQKNLTAGSTSVSPATLNFSAGVGKMFLSAPGQNKQGSVLLTADLSAKTWLRGAWTGGTYTVDPSARAAFGVYGAQPREFIFQRENY